MEAKRYAVFAIIEGLPENKIPLIQDKDKPAPAFWKLPGGKSEPGQCPEVALLRELDEEISVNIISPTNQDIVFEEDLGSHIFRVYRVRYFNGEINPKNEVKLLKLFTIEEIKRMIDGQQILPRHNRALSKYLNG